MLIRLWYHLAKRRRKQFIYLQFLILLGSLFETVSLGAVVPFLGVLAEPEPIYLNKYLNPIFNYFGYDDHGEILLPVFVAFISFVIVAAIARLILLWALVRFTFAAGADLSIKIYRHTLHQDYSVHVARNSSEVINGIITKTTTVTKGVIGPVLNLINTLVTTTGIISILLFISTEVTLGVFFCFGMIYLMVMYFTRGLLIENSQLIAEKSDLMVRSLQEGLEGIREVLINNNQKFYTKLYKDADIQMRHASWKNEMIVASPRYMMEALGIAAVALIAYIATIRTGGLNQHLPMLGAFVLGAQKLLPVIQKGYAAYSRIKGAKYSLIDVMNLLDQPIPDSIDKLPDTNCSFTKSIELKDVSFRFSRSTPWVLKNVNLNIPKGSVTGIIGPTGCGKSTLIDIIMGLLDPTSGELRVDNQVINNKNKKTWQAHISNVPQHIFLSDGTIEENIAFGVSNKDMDHTKIKKAAQQAQILNDIEGWVGGYQTLVGERGMKLSGGQRQRVGLARAFYREKDVIIFDEATSALDNETELAVIDAIGGFDKALTVVMIAHRLTTLKRCDRIVKFGKNHKIQELNYDDVIDNKTKTGDIDAQ